MYWFMSDGVSGWFSLFLLLAVLTIGGWFIATSVFRLYRRERLIVGSGIGIVGFIFFSNILGQFIPPEFSFWLAAFFVLLIGATFWFFGGNRGLDPRDLNIWPLLISLLAIAVLITLIGRGIAIFDDRKNLSIISSMAAGDTPPHFYMNPDYLFNYHYGFQLLGAGLMRVGGMYPWSAFDLSKGIAAALALLLAALWGWRMTRSKAWAVITGLLVAFASGSRWLLNFLPQSLIRRMSSQVYLWGASNSTVRSLYDGLSQSWTIDGGPPLPLPFGYINGILQPFILKLHKGPISLSLIILFLMLLLIGNARGWKGASILVVLFATWGLVAEAEFILFGFGFLVVFLWALARDGFKMTFRSQTMSAALLALIFGGIVSIFQGGTITEMIRGIVGIRSASNLGGGTGAGSFQLRWPPAIVSAHLGELHIASSNELVVGIFELGPAVLAGILILFWIRRWLERRRIAEASLALGSYAGFIIPMFLRYDVDRDITRMSAFALIGWIVLSVPILATLVRRYRSDWVRGAVGIWIGVSILGGLVVTGSLITAIPRATFSYQIADLDVHMTRRVWDQLPEDALVISAHEWRTVPVTGRLTRTSSDNTTSLDTWLEYVESPSLEVLVNAGFDYIYVDELWWQDMSTEVKHSFSRECVRLIEEVEDTSETHFRRLYDISRCGE